MSLFALIFIKDGSRKLWEASGIRLKTPSGNQQHFMISWRSLFPIIFISSLIQGCMYACLLGALGPKAMGMRLAIALVFLAT